MVLKIASNFLGVLAEHPEKQVTKYFRYLKRAHPEEEKNQLLARFSRERLQLLIGFTILPTDAFLKRFAAFATLCEAAKSATFEVDSHDS